MVPAAILTSLRAFPVHLVITARRALHAAVLTEVAQPRHVSTEAPAAERHIAPAFHLLAVETGVAGLALELVANLTLLEAVGAQLPVAIMALSRRIPAHQVVARFAIRGAAGGAVNERAVAA